MPRILWTAGLIGVAAWTLLAGSIYGLVNLFFLLAGGFADLSAFSAILPWLAALKALSSAVLIAIWLGVAAIILFSTLLLARVFRPNLRAREQARAGPGPEPAWMRSGPTIEGRVLAERSYTPDHPRAGQS